MQTKQECTLIWFRNDLRVKDNDLLKKAIQTKKYLIAFYVFDSVFYEQQYTFIRTGKFRTQFLIETLTELQQNLAVYNIPLFVSNGLTKNEIKDLSCRFSIKNIIYQSDNTFDELKIENEVLNELSQEVKTIKVYNQYLYNPNQIDVVFKNGMPKSFSSFRKKVEKKLEVENDSNYQIPIQKKSYDSVLEFPKVSGFKRLNFSAFPFKGGEKEGLKRIESYFYETQSVKTYKLTRNQLLGLNYSTKFSSWLANGSVSSKTIYFKLKDFENNIQKNNSTYWVYFELLWRYFFKYTARFQGNKMFALKGVQQKKNQSKNKNDTLIKQWIKGKTNNNFVNANMTELRKTGWMSNRGRQNVASYFIHDLKQDWRIGAAYFESMLIDYDPHSNYGNWMYIAGVGIDSSGKKFDVNWQANNYDPNKEYTNKWMALNE